MRIIGGAFRGRRLSSVGKGDEPARLRPTSDRVRESLYNVLMSRYAERIEGARVLDLFAGTGALGLEALSRGAARVVFVENGRVAQKLLRQNIELCGVADASQILARDARKLGRNPANPYDLIFLDPPYGKSLGEAALRPALVQDWISKDALIVWEEGGSIKVPDGLVLSDERAYGETVMRFLSVSAK
ncbi:MAG: 16S rRNA (guanine(966)-N(2))-methyltransferase RsmD [Pseudomonadota bacterium]